MKAPDVIRLTLNSSARVLTTYLADLTDSDLLLRPIAGMNHVAWQVGHLIAAEHAMMEGVKPGHSPKLPAGFAESHGKDTANSTTTAGFLAKNRYLELFNAQRAATLELLGTLSEQDLDEPGPERFKSFAPTIGALMNGAGTHVLMHMGQIVAVRRSTGKPVVI